MALVITILAVIGLLIYFGTRKKSSQKFKDNTSATGKKSWPGNTSLPNNTVSDKVENQIMENFESKLSELQFPDRIDAIVWHIQAIERGIAIGDLNLANLSYAKLIESIRQQNVSENGNFEDHLQTITKEYEGFRKFYSLEYPQQFLPPSERIKKEPSQKEVSQNDTLVYLETYNYYELPKSVIKHIDIVRTISKWNELGFKPKKDEFKRWNDIKRQERFFVFVGASISNSKHKLSLETGKRITTNPFYIKALVEQGIPLVDFIVNGEDLQHFINAANLFEEQNFEEALKEIDIAISSNAIKEYKELKKDIQVKLGNEEIVEQQFEKYEFDIDSPIHTGEIYDWFKAFLKNNSFDKVISYIEKTNETLDKLSRGQLKPKIYGIQSSEFYQSEKDSFNKNLFRIFDFNLLDLAYSDTTVKMLGLFIYLYTGREIKPIESIADIYVKWQLNNKALELYQLCLDRLANEEKPRVKARLIQKIDNLTA